MSPDFNVTDPVVAHLLVRTADGEAEARDERGSRATGGAGRRGAEPTPEARERAVTLLRDTGLTIRRINSRDITVVGPASEFERLFGGQLILLHGWWQWAAQPRFEGKWADVLTAALIPPRVIFPV